LEGRGRDYGGRWRGITIHVGNVGLVKALVAFDELQARASRKGGTRLQAAAIYWSGITRNACLIGILPFNPRSSIRA
jgi:hypothetical protein